MGVNTILMGGQWQYIPASGSPLASVLKANWAKWGRGLGRGSVSPSQTVFAKIDLTRYIFSIQTVLMLILIIKKPRSSEDILSLAQQFDSLHKQQETTIFILKLSSL